MELMETDDPIKSQLLMKTARHREELEDETRAIAERTEKIITNAIVIGGALALTYFLYTQFSGSKSKKSKTKKAKAKAVEVEDEEDEETSSAGNILSQVGTALVSQGGVLLLSLAKEKIVEYLAKTQKKDDENS